MLTLHHAPQSRSSRIVWLLEELGADYGIVYTDIPRQDGSGAPDPANPHPERKVPALVHDGVLVTESVAIMLYLTDLFPDAGLGPRAGERDRGPYLSWLAYYAGVIEPRIVAEFAGFADHAAVLSTYRGREEFDRRILGALEAHSWMLGDRFSAVDVLIANIGQWMRGALPEVTAVDDFLARCAARPAFAAAAAKDAPPA